MKGAYWLISPFYFNQNIGDRGSLARASGDYGLIVAHNTEAGISRVKLPSGAKKIISSRCRAMVGQVAGGGRTEKPLLKAGVSFHKNKAKKNRWPRVSANLYHLTGLNLILCISDLLHDCDVYMLHCLQRGCLTNLIEGIDHSIGYTDHICVMGTHQPCIGDLCSMHNNTTN